MGWTVETKGTEVHVMPESEDHQLWENCWCEPYVKIYDSGKICVEHRDMLDRLELDAG